MVWYGMVWYGIKMNIFKDNIINKCTSAYIVHHVLILQGTQLGNEAKINTAKNENFLNIFAYTANKTRFMNAQK